MKKIESTAHELQEIVRGHRADYLEARLEESRSSYLSYRGKDLDTIGRASSRGGNVRAMVNGAWGFASFNDLSDLPLRVDQAVDQARQAGSGKSNLGESPAVTASSPIATDQNPVSIPLVDKKAVLDAYNDIIWRTPKLKTSTVDYGDTHKQTIFVNSAGSYIDQERADVSLRLSAIATEDAEVQQAGLSLGSRGDFNAVKGLDAEVERMAHHAVSLLSAPQAKGGEYTVVLDPVLAGVFVHEAFGHLSESDFVYENEHLRQIMKLGRRFGPQELNIVDSAALPNLRGSYAYDDEGIKAQKTYLIREGELTGRLHSRETAAKMGEAATGNARAISYRYPPIVRMSNTYIEPGKASFEDLLADIKEGIYAKNWYGGTTSMEMFTFSAGEAYMIRNGRIAEPIRPVMLTGNVFQTLQNIDGIANDLDFNQGGGCGKGEQYPLPVSNGSPHIRISRCLVGGN